MNRLLVILPLTLVLLMPFQSISQLQASDWKLTDATNYAMETNGRATDPDGATVALRSLNTERNSSGSIASKVSADNLRQRRVTVSCELQTRGAGSASLWVRVDQDRTALLLENGVVEAIRGDSEWTQRTVWLPVPVEATSVSFGVLLSGGGSVTVRKLRFEVSAVISADTPLAAPAAEVLDAAVAIVKKNAMRSKDVNWDITEPKIRALAAGAQKTTDVYPAIKYMLSQLGDHHSFLMGQSQTSNFRNGGAQNPSPEVRALSEHIGYISVPGYMGAEQTAMRNYASKMHESIAGTMVSALCGWIVDLRPDTGGNMWPMLGGLKPFLGNGGLGTFDGLSGSSPQWLAGSVGVEPSSTLTSLESAWVAVLTGPRTASSGEAVTIAFRGRPHTRSFGQPTNGLSTANATFPLPDNSMILLTTAVDADRTGKRYGDKIDPDEIVEPAKNGTNNSDPALSVAIAWLKQSSGCAQQKER